MLFTIFYCHVRPKLISLLLLSLVTPPAPIPYYYSRLLDKWLKDDVNGFSSTSDFYRSSCSHQTPVLANGGTFSFHIERRTTRRKGCEVIATWMGGENHGTGTTAKKCHFLYYCSLGTVCCHNEHKNMHNKMLTIPLSGCSASPDEVWMMFTNSDPIFY